MVVYQRLQRSFTCHWGPPLLIIWVIMYFPDSNLDYLHVAGMCYQLDHREVQQEINLLDCCVLTGNDVSDELNSVGWLCWLWILMKRTRNRLNANSSRILKHFRMEYFIAWRLWAVTLMPTWLLAGGYFFLSLGSTRYFFRHSSLFLEHTLFIWKAAQCEFFFSLVLILLVFRF